MRNRAFSRVAGALLGAIGLAVVALWIRFIGGGELLAALAALHPGYAVALGALTLTCLLLRFVRWQFLLRRLGLRVPARASLSIYLASLAGIATPAYLGEAIRSVFLFREYQIPVSRSLGAWIVERVLDFVALAIVGAAAWTGSPWVIGVVAIAAGVLAMTGSRSESRFSGRGTLLPALGLSVFAWLPATLILGLAAHALHVPVAPIDGMRVFAASTIGGGLSLMPAGMGTTGSLAILQLDAAGINARNAVIVVSLMRLATAGLTLAIGGTFLLVQLHRTRRRQAPAGHFDAIADDYLDQFAPHIWELLLARKTTLLRSVLPTARPTLLGLDFGCGLGRQALALSADGYTVVGVDPATNLVRHAAEGGLPAVAGSGLELPFADGSFDFVYTVGVLHHLVEPGSQAAASAEIARVLRPGGVFAVHETNPRNPVFRLYMGYVFPLLREIDEGTERWIHPDDWRRLDALRLERVTYFTFLPDFLPRALLRLVLPLERWLEHSPLRHYSVHYMAVLRKPLPAGRPRREPAGAVAHRSGRA